MKNPNFERLHMTILDGSSYGDHTRAETALHAADSFGVDMEYVEILPVRTPVQRHWRRYVDQLSRTESGIILLTNWRTPHANKKLIDLVMNSPKPTAIIEELPGLVAIRHCYELSEEEKCPIIGGTFTNINGEFDRQKLSSAMANAISHNLRSIRG